MTGTPNGGRMEYLKYWVRNFLFRLNLVILYKYLFSVIRLSLVLFTY